MIYVLSFSMYHNSSLLNKIISSQMSDTKIFLCVLLLPTYHFVHVGVNL